MPSTIPVCPARCALIAALVATMTAHAAAQEKAAPAVCTAAPGALLARTASGWQSIRPGQAVPADTPVVALFDAKLRSATGGVAVRLAADVGQRGPLPILESAVVLREDRAFDLTLARLRGLVILTNIKQQGPATVRLLGRSGDTVELTLREPGARLAVEVYSRHAPGTPHLDDPKADEPVVHLFFIALEGESFLRHGEQGWTLHAPPGPAVLVWDSLLRQPEVQRLEELPPEIRVMKGKDAEALDAACAWAHQLTERPPADVLTEAADSMLARKREAAVTAMGALDELPLLLGTLDGSPHADARDRAVLVLRHWLGRAPGQTARLDAALRKASYSPTQARTVLQLLYGFTPEQQRDPNTYELLLEDLQHSKAAVRTLAHWHLVRLAPAGRSIAFDPLAPAAERARSCEQWRRLIPDGKLPPVKSSADMP